MLYLTELLKLTTTHYTLAAPVDDMTYAPIPVSAISQPESRSKNELITQLRQRGFGLLELDIEERVAAVERGLNEAAQLEGFRFPPINVEEVSYQPVHREVFTSLYQTAIDCLSMFARDELKESAGVEALFSQSPHEPFPRDHPFQPTFFNLFNYDHGSLNRHQDRGLMTVIHVEPPSAQNQPRSALWVEGPHGTWRNADRVIHNQQARSPDSSFALLLLGEEGEALLSTKHEGLYAAEHAVRVDPEGSFLARSHHQRDPAAGASGNRRSAALILRSSSPERHLEGL